MQVEQRAARVAGVDRRVGLDRLADETVLLGALDDPAQGADHADGEGLFQPKGVADGDHELADAHPIRVAQWHGGRQIAARIDVDHGQVVGRILADQLGLIVVTIGQGDQELVRALDDVEIGDNVTLAVIDKAGSTALLGNGLHKPVKGDAAVGNVDHRRADGVVYGDQLLFERVGRRCFVFQRRHGAVLEGRCRKRRRRRHGSHGGRRGLKGDQRRRCRRCDQRGRKAAPQPQGNKQSQRAKQRPARGSR